MMKRKKLPFQGFPIFTMLHSLCYYACLDENMEDDKLVSHVRESREEGTGH